MKCPISRRVAWAVALLLGTVAVAYGISTSGIVGRGRGVGPDARPGSPPSRAVCSDWPCLFGANHDSVSRETGVLTDWPATGPKEKWRRAIGAGYSAPVVADGHLIVFHRLG